MLYLFIYLAGIMDTLKEFIGGVLFFIVPTFLIVSVLYVSTKVVPEDYPESFKDVCPKIFKLMVTIFCFVSFLHISIPPKSVIYQIAGVYCGKQINQQIQIDKKLQKVSEIIDLQLEKSITELKKGQ